MFSLPSLPTDSLYKFIFIGGLILIIFSAYLDQHQTTSQSQESFSVDSLGIIKSTNLLGDSIKNLHRDERMKYLQKVSLSTNIQYVTMIRDKRSEAEIGIIKEMLDRYNEEMNQIVSNSDSLSRDYKNTYIEYQLRYSKAKINQKLAKENNHNIKIYFLFGMAMFLLGGILWCFKIQGPQDELQKIQLQMARLELQKQIATAATSVTNLPAQSVQPTPNPATSVQTIP